MTTLHAGGKFGGKVYDTSGGLHGVGASVVNALSDWMEVDVARDKQAHKMRFERGKADRQAEETSARSTGAARSCRSIPIAQIFGKDTHFSPRDALSHGEVEGVSVSRRRDPLEMRSVADQGRNAGRRHAEVSRRLARLPAAARSAATAPSRTRDFSGRTRKPRRQGRGRMGGDVDAADRSLRAFLLQHHPDLAGRHARAGPAQCADESAAHAMASAPTTRRPR